MRRVVPACLLLSVLTACGDDGKTAPRGEPAAPPTSNTPADPTPAAPRPAPAPPPSPSPLPPSRGEAASSWATTRVGDSATWEIRVVGSESVTKLTWRATKIDVAGVRYAVTARTLDVAGATKTLVEAEELHAPSHDPSIRTSDAGPGDSPEALTVAGRSISTRRSRRADGKTTLWTSDAVPFSGLVKSVNPDVEQVLVAFTRAP